MIEIIGSGASLGGGGSLDGFQIENEMASSENFEMSVDAGIEFEVSGGPEAMLQEGSLSNSVVDYIVGSKSSLIQKSTEIQESFLGDKEFTFKDKMQLLEKTYSYQLEMTFYNTFMAQTMQKVDSLIQLK